MNVVFCKHFGVKPQFPHYFSLNTDGFVQIHQADNKMTKRKQQPPQSKLLEDHRVKKSTVHIFYSSASLYNTNPIQQLGQEQCKTRQKPCRAHPET
jgi:hypothetical protein